MSGFLLDTNCISEAVAAKPDAGVSRWLEEINESQIYLSVLTLGEIRKGIALLPQSRKRSRLETWLNLELQARFFGRILEIDAAVADRWGVLTAEAKGRGRTVSVVDGLLAATALHHNLTIVSRNVADFAGTSVPVISPWSS
jgi:predicted nucleic acid-binding protein